MVGVVIFTHFLPTTLGAFHISIPNYWSQTYIIGYYIIGLYLKEYGIPLRKRNKVLLLIAATTIYTIMAITMFKDNLMDVPNGYNNLFCCIMSVLTFSLLLDIDTSKYKEKTKIFLEKTSEVVLPAYLVSYVTDIFIYKMIVLTVFSTVKERLLWAPVIIIVSAICSLTLGKITALITNAILNVRRKKI